MSDEKKEQVRINGDSIHVTGAGGDEVHVGPDGVHVKDGETEVKVSLTGIKIRDGKKTVSITVWKPLIGCAVFLLGFVALLTFIVAGIIKLML